VNLYTLSREEYEAIGIKNLPENLKDALKAFKKDPLMKTTLGDHIFNKFFTAKSHEWDEYRMSISEWELNRYLKNL